VKTRKLPQFTTLSIKKTTKADWEYLLNSY
jgi:hypothetical protein